MAEWYTDPQELARAWVPGCFCFCFLIKDFIFGKNPFDCHLVNWTVHLSALLTGSCCSLKSYFAVTPLSTGDCSFVFPSYRRKGNEVAVENLLQELPQQLAGYSDEKEGIFKTSSLQIKQGESHNLFVKTYFSAVFCFCKLWAALETILLLSVVKGLVPLLGLRCRVVFWGDAVISFWWLHRLPSSSNLCIWQLDQKSWRKTVLLGWKSLRCQPQGRVGNN